MLCTEEARQSQHCCSCLFFLESCLNQFKVSWYNFTQSLKVEVDVEIDKQMDRHRERQERQTEKKKESPKAKNLHTNPVVA